MKKHSMKKRLTALALSALMVLNVGALAMAKGDADVKDETVSQITLTPAQEGEKVRELVDILGGGDGLYKNGINGMDIYEYLGYVYMGWRTTGGSFQNFIINDLIMRELKEAGFDTTEEDVVAAYGSKSESDKSSATEGAQAWVTQFQGTESKSLGNVWDPEYAKLDVKLVKADGSVVEDAEAAEMASKISAESRTFNPITETYQRAFADIFGMDYEQDIASLPTTLDKVTAMHDVLMASEVEKDDRTSVDDFTYIQRASIGEPNKEAILNLRTRLAWNSCFTAESGVKPEDASPLSGELIYVGTVNNNSNTNSMEIPAEEIAGKVIMTDSSLSQGFTYASNNGAVGVASKTSLPYYLLPKDEAGNITTPWYTSSRYASGASLNNTINATANGTPVVEWQFSNEQYDNVKALLAKAAEINATAETEEDKVKIMADQIAIGTTYDMNLASEGPGVGQAVAIAEVKGSVCPEKRVLICAHVQEPGCNDNATGASALLGLTIAYKKLLDEGKIERPKCTMTFLWGDEMNLATYWMDSHPEEKANVIGSLDMDMTGEDPEKTGGVMRIEKTPDPSALYNYTLDAVPWSEEGEGIPDKDAPYYDKDYADEEGNFVRLPDSHTLWGAGSVRGLFDKGWYLNDLYMYVTSTVIDAHDPDFKVDVCPYEGGSDHSRFLAQNIPALLTWHFSDYTYHTSSDTLYMSSPRELESVAVTTLATGLTMADMVDDNESAIQLEEAVKEASVKRMKTEMKNTENHYTYAKAGKSSFADAYANEVEVLTAWADWYNDALASVMTLVAEPSEELQALVAANQAELKDLLAENIAYAKAYLDADSVAADAFDAIDAYVAEKDVDEALAAEIQTMVDLTKVQIAGEEDPKVVAVYVADLMQRVEKAIAADESEKAQKLADYKAAAQDEVLAYLNTYIDLMDGKEGLEAFLDAMTAISDAKDEAEVDQAVAAAKKSILALAKAVGPVTGLKASSANRTITLKWNKTPQAGCYKVYCKVKGADSYKLLDTVTATKLVTPVLKAGTSYTLKVVAAKSVDGKLYTGKSAVKTIKCAAVKAPTKLSLSSKSGKITVKWTKADKVDGYQVAYKAKGASEYKKLSLTSKCSVKTKALMKGTTYQVKVRAYKTVNGKKLYSAYTSVKTVKCK